MANRSAAKPIRFTVDMSKTVYRTLRGTHNLANLARDLRDDPYALRQYPDWPTINHYACTLFNHPTFTGATLDRLKNWLIAEQGRSKHQVLLMKLADVATLLRAAVPPATGVSRGEGTGGPPAADAGLARLSLESRALAMLVEHPDWSNTRIATALGCSRTSLHRLEKFKAARALVKAQGNAAMPKGEKQANKAMDAWDTDSG
jgi:hypothetical protein